MTLTQLNNLFRTQNPTGGIYRDTQTKYNVYFAGGQKTYIYKAKNLCELAVKLNLISLEDHPEAKARAERKAKAIADEKAGWEKWNRGEIESFLLED